MRSWHCQQRQKKSVLSCRCVRLRAGDSLRQFSVVFDILKTEQFYPVPSALWMHWQTSPDPVTKRPSCKLETGSWQEKTVHTAFRDWTKMQKLTMHSLNIFCHQQSWLVANSFRTKNTEKIRRQSMFCPCRRCELYISKRVRKLIRWNSNGLNSHESATPVP